MQKVKPGKSAKAAVQPLLEVAAKVESHPRLHADLHEVTIGIYEAARQGLEAYEDWKKRRRVVDFVDMVDRTLTLLHTPAVEAELRDRLDLVVVDEFQDTSPLQLALFVRLHALARRSTWVGDRKQCIFEFAGADPSLMESVTQWVRAEGGEAQQLTTNWRSRPELVDACSTLFAARKENASDRIVWTPPPERRATRVPRTLDACGSHPPRASRGRAWPLAAHHGARSSREDDHLGSGPRR